MTKMLIGESTKEKLINLVTKTFQMNSFCDNIAYNLDGCDFAIISDVFHHSFAHHFPEIADDLTGLMVQLDSQAIRGQLSEDSMDYNGNLVAMFADLVAECEKYRDEIIKTIEIAEYSGDYEVKIYGEEYLMQFMPYYKQARVWAKFAKQYENDLKSFDIHFKDFTTYINMV